MIRERKIRNYKGTTKGLRLSTIEDIEDIKIAISQSTYKLTPNQIYYRVIFNNRMLFADSNERRRYRDRLFRSCRTALRRELISYYVIDTDGYKW